MKFKVGDKVKLNGVYPGSCFNVGDIGKVIDIEDIPVTYPITIEALKNGIKGLFKEEELELYKGEEEYKAITINSDGINVKNIFTDKVYKININGIEEIKEDKMEKTFKEVIADIKEGEVWVGMEDWNLTIIGTGSQKFEMKFSEEINFYEIDGVSKFKLQRKEYTFQEAFKAYEEGKEIESCDYRYKKIDNRDYFYSTLSKQWRGDSIDFSLREIRNGWYIN